MVYISPGPYFRNMWHASVVWCFQVVEHFKNKMYRNIVDIVIAVFREQTLCHKINRIN